MGTLCKKDSAQVTMDGTEALGEVENVAFDSVGAAFDAIDTAFDAVASFNV